MFVYTFLASASTLIGQLFYPCCTVNSLEVRVDQTIRTCVPQTITRAAIDIGSGETKFAVATVDTTTNKIAKIWHQSFAKVALRENLAASKDGCLSEKVERELIDAIQKMQTDSSQYAPQEWRAVGTSVFRTSKNSADFIERIRDATGIHIHIVPQGNEAALGFASGVATSNEDPQDLIVWDSGAGSFQISTLINGQLETYGAEYGAISALETLFANHNLPFSQEIPLHPIIETEILALVDIIRAKLPLLPSWMTEGKKKIISIGRGTIFRKLQIPTQEPFNKKKIMDAMCKLSAMSIEELTKLAYPKNVIVDLIFWYAVMVHCGFDEVAFFPTNGICEGLLVGDEKSDYQILSQGSAK